MPLPFLRRVVLGVLRDVTVGAGFLDLLDDLRAIDVLETLEFLLKHRMTARRHRDPFRDGHEATLRRASRLGRAGIR